MKGTLEILVCANNANLLGGNKHTFSEGNGRWTFLVASKEFSEFKKLWVKV